MEYENDQSYFYYEAYYFIFWYKIICTFIFLFKIHNLLVALSGALLEDHDLNFDEEFGQKISQPTREGKLLQEQDSLPFLNEIDDRKIGKTVFTEDYNQPSTIYLDRNCVCKCDVPRGPKEHENPRKLPKLSWINQRGNIKRQRSYNLPIFTAASTKQKVRKSLIEYSIAAQTNRRKLAF